MSTTQFLQQVGTSRCTPNTDSQQCTDLTALHTQASNNCSSKHQLCHQQAASLVQQHNVQHPAQHTHTCRLLLATGRPLLHQLDELWRRTEAPGRYRQTGKEAAVNRAVPNCNRLQLQRLGAVRRLEAEPALAGCCSAHEPSLTSNLTQNACSFGWPAGSFMSVLTAS